jgi:cold shock CspA family protein
MATTATVTDVTSGRVKWFNNKAGYGFISVPDCETGEERDMFVHHSEIKVDQAQYKYLVQGEYVEFVIAPINRENKIDMHATSVRGINSGKLMCETRNEVRSYRASSEQSETRQQGTRQQGIRPQETRPQTARQTSEPRQQEPRTQAPRQQASRPQTTESKRPQLEKADQTDWMVVPRRRADTMPSKKKSQPRQRQPEIEIA